MERIVQFLFVVAVPILAVAGAVIALFAAGALFWALDNPQQASRSVEALFRRPPKPPKPAGESHYYRRYWSR